MAYQPQRLMGSEQIHGDVGDLDDATVLDFWQWAFSNLCANNIRGIFAEWMVAKLLGITQPLRESWGEWDLLSEEGVRIEVKASAYVQAWEQVKPSSIQFTRLKSRRLDAQTNLYSEQSTYNADIYVFCVQIELDAARWNALDLAQWRFYALSQVEMALIGYRSLSLAALERRCPAMTAGEFSRQTCALIQAIAHQTSNSRSQIE